MANKPVHIRTNKNLELVIIWDLRNLDFGVCGFAAFYFVNIALKYSRFILAMWEMEISLGQTASHSA